MENDATNRPFRTFRMVCALVLFLATPLTQAQLNPLGGQVPQIPAFLPSVTEVPMTQKLPIDGDWIINTIRKRIRIEGGRAYALDPWVHMFVLKIEPLMVVLKDLRRTGPRQYGGEDLPLLGQLTATLTAEGYLNVSVAGTMGPAKYVLIPVRMDNQQIFDQEKSGHYTPPAPTPAPTAPLQPAPVPQPAPQSVIQPAPVQPASPPVAQPAPATGTVADPNLANCKVLAVDRTTGKIICKD